MKEFNRADFNAELTSRADELCGDGTYVVEEDPFDKVFCHIIADTFETLDEESFTYTDGTSDHGIDFYIREGGSFRIYQCKSIDEQTMDKGKTFDTTCVNELAEAIDFLTNDERQQAASEPIRRLWSAFNSFRTDNTLTATLAIQGRLSPNARERFDTLKEEYAQKNIDLRLIDEETLFREWHSLDDLEKPKNVKLKLRIVEGGLMKMGSWFCAIFEIGSLLDGMARHGNALFDLNVRSKLKKSKINDEIKLTISKDRGQKQFVHLNNGLVITCTNFSFDSSEETVTLNRAQVINGCQTLSTIWDYYQNAGMREKEKLRENVRVFAKVIDGTQFKKDNLLEKIIVASNNQNSMNERNLKSNQREQLEIQRAFRNEPRSDLRYFYIRKDGELDSLIDNKELNNDREMKPRYFEIEGTKRRGKNKYRNIDNEDLAKIWWSWIGHGSIVNCGQVHYFTDQVYPHIFQERPGDAYWENMKRPNAIPDEKLLEEGSPTSFEYLVAIAFANYIEYNVKPKSFKQYKTGRIEYLKSCGTLKENPTRQEEAEALTNDDEYLLSNWSRQMTSVFTEIASWILVQKYGALHSDLCKKILDQEDVHYWLANGMDRDKLEDEEMKGGMMQNLYASMRYASDRHLREIKSAILLENRPKMLLGKPEQIAKIKSIFLEFDKIARDYPVKDNTKKPGQSLLESLPDLY